MVRVWSTWRRARLTAGLMLWVFTGVGLSAPALAESSVLVLSSRDSPAYREVAESFQAYLQDKVTVQGNLDPVALFDPWDELKKKAEPMQRIAILSDVHGNLPALEVPPLTGRVNDTAGMLSATTRQQLEDVLARLEQTDSTQIVVLTIPSLGGEVLEEFSIKVVDQWKIGQKGLDNGALLMIAKNDRKIRIEVGYGLEGSLTDLMAGRIIRNVIVPHFKAGNFDQGVIEGVQAMIKAVRDEYKASEKGPGGRGHGEPIRLTVDLGNDQTVIEAFLYDGTRRFLVAYTLGF